jgi:hypothetical protein
VTHAGARYRRDAVPAAFDDVVFHTPIRNPHTSTAASTLALGVAVIDGDSLIVLADRQGCGFGK